MRIRIRIYIDKEPELYALYRASGASLTRKIFRRSIIAYLEGQDLGVDIPPVKITTAPPLTPNPMFDISIDDKYQKALSKLPAKSLSVFTKTLVRYYAFWAMTDAFGVPHAQPVLTVSEKIDKPSASKVPNKDIAPIKQPAKESIKDLPPKNVSESALSISNIENSDINSLSALFKNIKMS